MLSEVNNKRVTIKDNITMDDKNVFWERQEERIPPEPPDPQKTYVAFIGFNSTAYPQIKQAIAKHRDISSMTKGWVQRIEFEQLTEWPDPIPADWFSVAMPIATVNQYHSEYPYVTLVYVYYNPTTSALVYTTTAETVYTWDIGEAFNNGGLSGWFEDYSKCEYVDISWINTSKCKDMCRVFSNLGSGVSKCILHGLQNWDFSALTNEPAHMFWKTTAVIPKFMTFNFTNSQLTKIEHGLFRDVPNLTQDIWDTMTVELPNITILRGAYSVDGDTLTGEDEWVFSGLPLFDCNLSNFHFGKPIRRVSYIMTNCNNLVNIDFSAMNVDITGSGKMSEILYNVTAKYLHIENWNFYNIDRSGYISHLFHNCPNLERIYVNDKWVFNTAIQQNPGYDRVICNCPNLRSPYGRHIDLDSSTGFANGWCLQVPNNPAAARALWYIRGNSRLTYGKYLKKLFYQISTGQNVSEDVAETREITNITEVRFTRGDVIASQPILATAIAIQASGVPVWAWKNGSVLYIGSESAEIYSNYGQSDVKYNSLTSMFAYFTTATKIDVSWINTSKAQLFNRMFLGCERLKEIVGLETLDFSSNAGTYMEMFKECIALPDSIINQLNQTNIGENCISPAWMFHGCWNFKQVSIDWNFHKCGVETPADDATRKGALKGMFYDCENLEYIDFSECTNTENITNIAHLIGQNFKISYADFSSLTCPNLTNMESFCIADYELKLLVLGKLSGANVVSMENAFGSCTKLTTIYIDPVWNYPPQCENQSAFYNSTALVGGKGTTYPSCGSDAQYGKYARIDSDTRAGYFTDIAERPDNNRLVTGASFNVKLKSLVNSLVVSPSDEDNTVTKIVFDHKWHDGVESTPVINLGINDNNSIYGNYIDSEKTLYIHTYHKTIKTNVDAAHMFDGFTVLDTTLDLSMLDLSETTDFSDMFNLCQRLPHITWSDQDYTFTNANISLTRMFTMTSSLDEVDLSHFKFLIPKSDNTNDGLHLDVLCSKSAITKFIPPQPSIINSGIFMGSSFYQTGNLKSLDLRNLTFIVPENRLCNFHLTISSDGALTEVWMPTVTQTTAGSITLDEVFANDRKLAFVDFSNWNIDSANKLVVKKLFTNCSALRRIFVPLDSDKFGTPELALNATDTDNFAGCAVILHGDTGRKFTSALNTYASFKLDTKEHPALGSAFHGYIKEIEP